MMRERAALLRKLMRLIAKGPFRPDWESLRKYEAPEWYRGREVRDFHSLGSLFGSGF